MSKLAPKPIIASVIQTWNVDPGMKIALVEDLECQTWIVESCPAGTHFWTPVQARSLSHTGRVGAAIRAALSTVNKLPSAAKQVQPLADAPTPLISKPQTVRVLQREPSFVEPERRGVARPLRRVAQRNEKVPVCS